MDLVPGKAKIMVLHSSLGEIFKFEAVHSLNPHQVKAEGPSLNVSYSKGVGISSLNVT